ASGVTSCPIPVWPEDAVEFCALGVAACDDGLFCAHTKGANAIATTKARKRLIFFMGKLSWYPATSFVWVHVLAYGDAAELRLVGGEITAFGTRHSAGESMGRRHGPRTK